MDNQRFESVVLRLEKDAAQHPSRHRTRVILIALLGYAALFGTLLTLLALIGLLGVFTVTSHTPIAAFKLGIPLIAVTIAIFKAFRWEQVEIPGIEISKTDAPQLFGMLEEVRTALHSPLPDRVLLNDEFNAAMAQIPRFGVLGRHTNTLIIGLPLMQALTKDQFRFVVAHEFGHLSGRHGRLTSWIYRQRQIWTQLNANFQRGSARRGRKLLRAFLGWYAPYLNAHTFVLARSHEYMADRCAAEVTSPLVAAQALTANHIKKGYIAEHFWPSVFQLTAAHEAPPPIYRDLYQGLHNRPPLELAQQYFLSAVNEKTGVTDTHPALRDRLKALGFLDCGTETFRSSFLEEGESPENAASAYLGAKLVEYIILFENHWQKNIEPRWKAEFKRVQEARQKKEYLEKAREEGTLNEQDEWDLAVLMAELGDKRSAIALMQQIAEKQPENMLVHYVLGKNLLEIDDEHGLDYLDTVIAHSPSLLVNAASLGHRYLTRHGCFERGDTYRLLAQNRQELLSKAKEERSEVTGREKFLSHEMPEEDRLKLIQQVAAIPQVKSAFLVRKAVQYMPEKPCYVLFVIPRYGFTVSRQQARNQLRQQMAKQLKTSFQLFYLVIDPTDTRLIKLRFKIKDAQIIKR